MIDDSSEFPPAKRALLSESLKLFASRGVEAVSIRDIAQATGYSNPALFRHFASKEDLARTLFETCYRSLVDSMESSSAADGLEAWIAAVMTGVAASPEAVLYVLDNLKRYFHDLPADLRERNLGLLAVQRLKREQAAGRVRADLELRLAVQVLLGAFGQLARGAHFNDVKIDPIETARALAGMLNDGFAPRKNNT